MHEDSHHHSDQAPHADGISPLHGALANRLGWHQHDHTVASDDVLETSTRGIWAIKVSLIILMLTAMFQIFVVASSGSVGLLADTLHNFSDALTAVPLWLAYTLDRRQPNRRYSYGYGRAEDLAGAVVVLMILISLIIIAFESMEKIIHPQPLINLGWVAFAAFTGFLGNEAVAVFRLRVGHEIGSAALVADGWHARVDGITSLGVLLGALGAYLGWTWADPLIGCLISIVILFILRSAVREMWYRLMDATDPELLQRIEDTASHVHGVQSIHALRARWVGHRLHAELHVDMSGDLTLGQGHEIAEAVRQALIRTIPRLSDVLVHLDPVR
jgi:cation diffusion facilitator family transporter